MSNDNQPSSSMSKEENDQDNEETIVTMVDVLKAEEILEENADAVLGPGDDKNCTYNELKTVKLNFLHINIPILKTKCDTDHPEEPPLH
ncbi:hypothetical protein J6590_045247 [Homalodisca vitripennis]|nr:hypothetical protein J6590_045247 [Homalodisca vitripennis]